MGKFCMAYLYHRSLNQSFQHQSTAKNIIKFLCHSKLFQQHSSTYCSYSTRAIYLLTHDIHLYCTCFITVRSSPLVLFKLLPSVCLCTIQWLMFLNVERCAVSICMVTQCVTVKKETDSNLTHCRRVKQICVLTR